MQMRRVEPVVHKKRATSTAGQGRMFVLWDRDKDRIAYKHSRKDKLRAKAARWRLRNFKIVEVDAGFVASAYQPGDFDR